MINCFNCFIIVNFQLVNITLIFIAIQSLDALIALFVAYSTQKKQPFFIVKLSQYKDTTLFYINYPPPFLTLFSITSTLMPQTSSLIPHIDTFIGILL